MYPTHADSDVHWAAVRLPMRVEGQNPDLDLLTRLISGPVHLDESGKALGVQVKLGLVDKHLRLFVVAVDLKYQLMPVGGIIHMDLQRQNGRKCSRLSSLGCLNLTFCVLLRVQNFEEVTECHLQGAAAATWCFL